jgi:hypothetical protein
MDVGREITREDALKWLTDWLSKPTSVDVKVECAGACISVLSAFGELHYWSDGSDPWPGAAGDVVRENMYGVYIVEGAHFGIGESQPASGFALHTVGESEELRVAYGEGVELVVTQESMPRTLAEIEAE